MSSLLSFFAFWEHNLSKFVPFLHNEAETFGVRWYGLAYVAAFLTGAWLMRRYAEKGRSQLPADKIPDLIVVLVLGVFLGGRLGWFLFYDWERLISDKLSFFRVWEGGMASHGGFIGVALAMAWFARSRKLPFLHLADVVVSTAPIGLFFGRIANFINGELWGKVTDGTWGIIFPDSGDRLPRHPSQLYQAALEGLLLFLWMQFRMWRGDVVKRQPGRISGEFLVGYAILRAIGEIWREPDKGGLVSLGSGPDAFWLSKGTFYSIFVLVAGFVVMWVAWWRSRRPKA